MDVAERAGYRCERFAHDGMDHPVYAAGRGPVVLLLHELPALSSRTIDLAELIRKRGFRVVLPAFLDTVRARPGAVDFLRNTVRVCVSWQFAALAQRRTSAISGWLLALAERERAASGHDLVGVVGMCLSGSFALATAVDPRVGVAVVSQPGLPFAIGPLGWIRGQKADLGISDDDLGRLRARRDDPDLCIRSFRYRTDWIAPLERMERLVEELAPGATFTPIAAEERAHPVLTNAAQAVMEDDLDDPAIAALEAVLATLEARLLGGSPAAPDPAT